MSLEQKVIRRYNEDVSLFFRGADRVRGNVPLPSVSSNSDFSLSFFYYRSQSGSFAMVENRTGSGYVNGLFVGSNGAQILYFNIGGISYLTNYVDVSNRWNHVVLTNEGTTNITKVYVNGLLDTEVTNSGNGTSGGELFIGRGLANFIGSLRNVTFFDKVLTGKDISVLYDTGIPSEGSRDNVQHLYPLNGRPYLNGADIMFKDVVNLYNPSALAFDLKTDTWTDIELGVSDINTATVYRDWHSKQQVIPTSNYQKGLNFDSSKQQCIEVTGLESFDKNDGYTFLIGVEKQSDTGQQSIFSCVGDEGFSRYFDIFRRGGGNDNEFQFVSPLSSIVSVLSSIIFTGIDSTKNNFITYHTGDKKYINPYNTNVLNKIIDVNCQQTYPNVSPDPLGFGFDEITNPKFNIGARLSTSLYLNGKIYLFAIVKGSVTKEEEKRIWNNGFYRNPIEVLGDRVIYHPDFHNPFLDNTTVKFPDLVNNCESKARGIDWGVLSNVQNSID